jgi:hypothetical protein
LNQVLTDKKGLIDAHIRFQKHLASGEAPPRDLVARVGAVYANAEVVEAVRKELGDLEAEVARRMTA